MLPREPKRAAVVAERISAVFAEQAVEEQPTSALAQPDPAEQADLEVVPGKRAAAQPVRLGARVLVAERR